LQKRFFKLFLGLTIIGLLCSVAGPAQTVNAAPSTYRDVKGHWAAGPINKWIGLGLVGGYPDGTFGVSRMMTRAEFVAFVNRAFGYTEKAEINFTDVKPTAWFAGDVAKAIAMGYISVNADGAFKPNQPISRLEAAQILYKVLRLEPVAEDHLAPFKDVANLSVEDKVIVNAIVAKALFGGYPDKTLQMQGTVTRAQMVAILSRAAGEIYNQATTFGPETGSLTVKGNATISKPNVTLRNVEISGDLYITEGVGDGDFYLKNVKVAGRTIVAGGGSNSGHIEGDSSLPHLIITYPDGTTRIVVVGKSSIGRVEFREPGTLDLSENESETAPTVTIDEDIPAGSTVQIVGAFAGVELNAPGVTLQVGEGSVVENITVNQTATGSQLNVSGNVTGSITTNAPKTEITVQPKASVAQISVGTTATGTSVGVQGTVTTLQTSAQIGVNVGAGGSLPKVELQPGANNTTLTTDQGVTPPTVTAPPDVSYEQDGKPQTGDSKPQPPTTGGDTTGGDDTPAPTPTASVTKITAYNNDTAVTNLDATPTNGTFTINLTNSNPATLIDEFRFQGNVSNFRINLQSLTWAGRTRNNLNRYIDITNQKLALNDLLGTAINTALNRTDDLGGLTAAALTKGDLSVGTLKQCGGSQISLSGTLSASGYNSAPVTLVLNIGGSDDLLNFNAEKAAIVVNRNTNQVGVALKVSNTANKLADASFATKSAEQWIGYIKNITAPELGTVKLKYGGGNWTALADADIKQWIETHTGKAWSEITLGELAGFTARVQRGAVEYTVTVTVVTP